MISKTSPKSLTKIAEEWDCVAQKRQEAIDNGKDLSLQFVTMPCIKRNLLDLNAKLVVDVGCGTGYLTHEISTEVFECWGVDQSAVSIDIAKERYRAGNLHFSVSSIREYKFPEKVDFCVANMVFMGDPEWQVSVKHIYDELPTGGRLLFTIAHPWFWPKYWNYCDLPWFNYSRETYIESDFNISLERNLGITTHIHRPLSLYINTLISTGFLIKKIEEPMPVIEMPKEYENGYPRFAFFLCEKH